ncbi:MAG: hypothetical protein KG003_04095 [Bacteroidetes bacterium]|nr:hypothetical protein [Bacteroidota bacterium]
MKHILPLIAMTTLILGTVACKKERPPVTKETAIIGSEWYHPVTDSENHWTRYFGDQTGKDPYYRTDMFAPDITTDVMNNSVVLIYAKLRGYDELVWPIDYVGLLPTAVYLSSFQNSEDQWSIGLSSGNISIRLKNSLNNYPVNGPDARHEFRYIIVPKNSNVTGQKPVTSNPLGQYSEDELRSLPYDEVCRMAGLDE